MKQHFFDWQQKVQKLIAEFNDNKYGFIGDKSLQNAIDMYIKDESKQYNIEEAELLFNKEWGKIVEKMKSSLKQQDKISEEQFKDIGQNLYRQNFRKMIKVDEDR